MAIDSIYTGNRTYYINRFDISDPFSPKNMFKRFNKRIRESYRINIINLVHQNKVRDYIIKRKGDIGKKKYC